MSARGAPAKGVSCTPAFLPPHQLSPQFETCVRIYEHHNLNHIQNLIQAICENASSACQFLQCKCALYTVFKRDCWAVGWRASVYQEFPNLLHIHFATSRFLHWYLKMEKRFMSLWTSPVPTKPKMLVYSFKYNSIPKPSSYCKEPSGSRKWE